MQSFCKVSGNPSSVQIRNHGYKIAQFSYMPRLFLDLFIHTPPFLNNNKAFAWSPHASVEWSGAVAKRIQWTEVHCFFLYINRVKIHVQVKYNGEESRQLFKKQHFASLY